MTSKIQIFLDSIVVIITIILIWLFRPDITIFCFYVFLYPYLYITNRKKYISCLVISSAVALFWILVASDHYDYNHETVLILGLNTYPLFMMASGLFAVYIFYKYLVEMLKTTNWVVQFLLFSVSYWVFLILAETIAYHVFNIHNLATANYSGLPICNCIHAPAWMQLSYILLGPIYYFFVTIFNKVYFSLYETKKNHS